MKYNVHAYINVRVKVLNVEAESQVEACKKAEEFLSNHGPVVDKTYVGIDQESLVEKTCIGHVEDAEESLGYLVDEVGDTEYRNTTYYKIDAKGEIVPDTE
jgi:hypothetical protein